MSILDWNGTISLADAIANARVQGKELYIQPGSYDLGFTAISAGGAPGTRALRIYATPRTVTLNFTTDDLFFWIEQVSDIEIEGIDFDGKNRALSAFARPGLVTAVGASNLVFRNCQFFNSTQVGLRLQNCGTRRGSSFTMDGNELARPSALVENCAFEKCDDAAIYTYGSPALRVSSSTFTNLSNNGIQIEEDTPIYNGTIISGNSFSDVRAENGGSGPYGNAVSLFRVNDCLVEGNTIHFAAFSAVRANVCAGTVIQGNNCYGIGEVALYVEETPATTGNNIAVGNIVANNFIDWCGQGISVANFMSGARNATVTGNVIRNCRTLSPSRGLLDIRGIGISAEADAVVSGNTIECAQRFGIIAGAGTYSRNLVITDNVIRSTPVGIVASEQTSASTPAGNQAGHTLISNNMIQVTSSDVNDGIVTSNYGGTDTTFAIVSRMNLITSAAYPRLTLPATNVLHNMATPSMGTDACRTTPPFG
ncbi:TIGR03808 family TAT-translocated repetitive protein [Brucella oryzae]|uniref:TIGR03808 family TAT-translocated repetitive protein n=1 Tax=Brucella oryzae TaxID=335286 RepID=A0A2S7IUH7_9HYPH|nr:TIGR03808 family TAT-translocated repetitive protein [Brucella oryzae]PQA71616.1 TIGR03808 family TAT-translocated repetitive protein [Brucella oryzae]